MLMIKNFQLSFDTKDTEFIKKKTEKFRVDNKTYTVQINFYNESVINLGLVFYNLEILYQDYDKTIFRKNDRCIMDIDEYVCLLNHKITVSEYQGTVSKILRLLDMYPKDVSLDDIHIKFF
jgi:hypothetical protein